MARLSLALLLLGCCTTAVWSVNDRLREVFSWRQVDFAFPDQRTRQAAIESGLYVQANNLPLGLEVWRDRLFITVPRWKAGVASTLNYVSLGSGNCRYAVYTTGGHARACVHATEPQTWEPNFRKKKYPKIKDSKR